MHGRVAATFIRALSMAIVCHRFRDIAGTGSMHDSFTPDPRISGIEFRGAVAGLSGREILQETC